MMLNFEVKETQQNAFGTFIVGKFLEAPPYFASDQKLKLGQYEFEIFGKPKADVWTLKLESDLDFNEVLEEQTVYLQVL